MSDTLPVVLELLLILFVLLFLVCPELDKIADLLESINNHLAEESSEDAPECQHQQSKSATL